MDKIKNYFRQSEPLYEPVSGDRDHGHDREQVEEDVDEEDTTSESNDGQDKLAFSRTEYGVFFLLGVSMLWAWNMFLAAAPYFLSRFQTNVWIANHFQPAQVSVATVTNLIGMLVLSKLQEKASYPRRIVLALIINIVSFFFLSLSTFVHASPQVYFGFMILVVFASSLGTALLQNGVFAFAAGFGSCGGQYMQGIMVGQAFAGVLPPMVQIISVAAVRKHKTSAAIHIAQGNESSSQSPKSAFIYFITAVAVLMITLLAFFHLLRRMSRKEAMNRAFTANPDELDHSRSSLPQQISSATTDGPKTSVALTTLFKKLPFLSVALVLCFAVTMIYPVFTTSIVSSSGINLAIFIPLAFLMWNLGDLTGRVITVAPQISLTHYPFALFCLAMTRLLFIPLYFLCNIKDRGAIVHSDAFYLVVVQFLFGLSNGYLGSQCMVGAGDWVLPEEREAAGAFMGLMLVAGLTVGSLLSFLLGDI